MIPVLGVAILNRPDLLYEMLLTVDVPVERTVIIDNGGVVERDRVPGEVLVQPGHNLGVAASWNLIIKSNPTAPWWLISNFDVKFGSGDLARIEKAMETHEAIGMHGLAIFAVSQSAMAKVGFFDENFIPAYYEDNDWVYRAKLAGVEVPQFETTSFHATSSTIASDPHLQDENHRTFSQNARYYRSKWGGMPYEERYQTPFDKGGHPNEWRLDMERLAELSWRP
jgi:GT2 family glycosyltransferase